jgi:glycine/D-amino acid oxidase-like deaminating enzyme
VAWQVARAGVRVAVLEAQYAGRGSTAASTALLMQEPDKDFDELAGRYGTKAARRIWHLSAEATREFSRALRSLGIACEFAARDSVYYAISPRAAARLAGEIAARRRAGISGEWLDRADLRRLTGIAGSGAIRTTGNAQINPYLGCLGLLRAAGREGAAVFERSPVARIEPGPHGAELRVNGRRVRCDRLVVATGYATPYFAPIARRFRMLQTYVAATRPIAKELRRELGLGDVMLWDTARPYHYARWTPDDRHLLGGGDRPPVAERQRASALRDGAARVWRYFLRRYPALERAGIDYAWEGLFATTPDGLPYIGPHADYPRHLFALGYGGNGMTFGFLAGRLLLEQYRGRRSRDHALFGFER